MAQGNNGSAAAKRLAEEKANRGRGRRGGAGYARLRKDPADRSGMGESASSNVTKKGKNDFTSADVTGIEAFKKTLNPQGSNSMEAADAMYGSIQNAYAYRDRQRKLYGGNNS